MAEIGQTGLNQSFGIIQDDFLREWRGKEAYKRANEMRLNSPVIGAMLAAIEQAVVGVDWTLTSEQGEDDPRLGVWKAFTETVQGGLQNHVREALSFLPFGFALFETVWGRSAEGYVVAAKLAPRGQDTVFRWLLAENGDIEGFVQQAAPKYELVAIPAEKLLHYRNKPERNNPEGRSILRPAWVPYYYAKNIQQIEGIGVERDLAGLPVMELPEGASTDESDPNSDASKAAQVVRNIRRDEQEGIVLPSGWKLSLLSTGGTRQFDTDKIINRYESRMLMVTLAQFLLLGQEGIGSYALSSDQTDMFTTSVNATADIVGSTIASQLLPRMMALNGFTAQGLTLDHSPAGDIDPGALAEMLQKLGGYLTWTTADELWLRKVLNLHQPSADEIEELREEKAEQAAAVAAAGLEGRDLPQRTQRRDSSRGQREEEGEDALTPDPSPDGRGEDNLEAAQFFAARPDAARRRKAERAFQKVWGKALAGLKKKVVDAAKAARA